MRIKDYIINMLVLTAALAFSVICSSQSSSCPPNIDFSLGNFGYWECKTGIVSGFGGQNTTIWLASGQETERHEIIPVTSQQADAFGGFPVHCPGTNTPSVRLGNSNNGHQAEALFYTFTIPANNNHFSLLYYYAVVLQNPDHMSFEQPRFRARVVDVATETEMNCVSFDFAASSVLLGFKPGLIEGSVYKGWTPVTVDLSGCAGKTIRLEFITSDCVFEQHFGYAYISVSPSCNNSLSGANYCDGDSTITITAPFGYMNYNWFSDNSFSSMISDGQTLYLNSGPAAIGSVFPVVLYPYEGYGCQDTLYATIGTAVRPESDAGPDVTVCSKGIVQLGGGQNSEYSYTWSPKNQLYNFVASNTRTRPGIRQPTNFILTTTDMRTGCKAYDSVLVTPILVDTLTNMTGREGYCPGGIINTTLTLNNTAAQVQWFNGSTMITGNTGSTTTFAYPGVYWAELKQFGCVDSTRQFNVRMVPPVIADFILDKDIQCVNHPVYLRNMSTASGEPLEYQWEMNDGYNSTFKDIERIMPANGIYTVSLVATSPAGCKDSLSKRIKVLDDCLVDIPDAFTPNKDGLNDRFRPILTGKARLKKFIIYNRYGRIMFETNKDGLGWDGTYKGMLQQTAVFIWTLEFVDENRKTVNLKGTFTLIN